MYSPRSVIKLLFFTSTALLQVTLQDAKADPENSFATWIGSIANIKFSNGLRVTTLLQPRWSFDNVRPKADGELQLLVAMGALGYELLPKVILFQGYGALSYYEPTNIEHRTYQNLVIGRAFESWKLSERYGLEQRWFEGAGDISWRGRILERAQHPVAANDKLSVVVSEELLATINNIKAPAPQRGFNQNRFFLGLNFAFSDSLSLDFGYMNQFVNLPAGRDNLSNHILSITLFSNFSWD